MDWNWYFSALAQSAAAIVGLFGAFVITKILTNQSAHTQKTNRAKEVLAESQRIVDSANDLSIDWYLKSRIEDETHNLIKHLDENDTLEPEVYYDKLNFPYLLERQKAIRIIENEIEHRRKRICSGQQKPDNFIGGF